MIFVSVSSIATVDDIPCELFAKAEIGEQMQ